MSRAIPRKLSITVWRKQYEVKVYQKSRTVREAAGNYQGKPVTVTGRSELAAIRRCEEAARYRGKDGPSPSKAR